MIKSTPCQKAGEYLHFENSQIRGLQLLSDIIKSIYLITDELIYQECNSTGDGPPFEIRNLEWRYFYAS